MTLPVQYTVQHQRRRVTRQIVPGVRYAMVTLLMWLSMLTGVARIVTQWPTKMSEIKWAYDETTGSFSALPASPFLLLALISLPFLWLIGKGINKYKFRPQPLPPNFDPKLYEQYRLIYKRLKAKRDSGQKFDYVDGIQWSQVRYPPWRTDSDPWVYD